MDHTGQATSGRVYFGLRHQEREFNLLPGRTIIGRSAGCQLVLNDALVSRRHAQIRVTPKSATLEDLGSANGVYLNGERLQVPRELEPGDRIVVGKQEMVVYSFAAPGPSTGSNYDRAGAATLSGVLPSPSQLKETDLHLPESEATEKGDTFDLLGAVAEKVLALGRGIEAERILSTALNDFLRAAQSTGQVDRLEGERAASYAVKLADATGQGKWIDYAVQLYTVANRPLPSALVDQLYTVLRNVSPIDLVIFRTYVKALQEAQERFGPAERFLVQRIAGLERLASL